MLATVSAATETAEAIQAGVDTDVVAGCGELFGRDAHATCPTPEAAARWVARRALETLTYLTRASHVFASRVALVAVRESDVVEIVARAAPVNAKKVKSEEGSGSAAHATTSTLTSIESVQDRKGKRPREKARLPSGSGASVSRGKEGGKEKDVESVRAEGAETESGVPDALEEGDPGAFSSAAAPLVLLRLLGSPAFESHAALVELALASLLSVLTASKKERERLAHDWRQNATLGDADGDEKSPRADKNAEKKPRGERRSDALEPWRLGFAAAPARDDRDGETKTKERGEPASSEDKARARSDRSGGGVGGSPPLGGLRPLSSAAIRKAVLSAPPSTTRALARLVARDALTSGAQTKAFDLVRALSATAPEGARRSRRRSPRRRRRAPRTPSPRSPRRRRRRAAESRATRRRRRRRLFPRRAPRRAPRFRRLIRRSKPPPVHPRFFIHGSPRAPRLWRPRPPPCSA